VNAGNAYFENSKKSLPYHFFAVKRDKVFVLAGGFNFFFIFTPKIGEDSHLDDHIFFKSGLVQPPRCFFSIICRSDRWRRHNFGDLAPLRALGCCLASSHHGRGGDLVVEWFLGVIEMSSFCKLKASFFLETWFLDGIYVYICIFMYTYIYICIHISRKFKKYTFNRQQLIVCSMETSSLVYTPLN